MATISIQPISNMVSDVGYDGPVRNGELSLFNVSPMPTPPITSCGLPRIYSSVNPLMRSRRTEKLLLKRKRMEKLKSQQLKLDEKQGSKLLLHFPRTGNRAKMSRTPRVWTADAVRRSSRDAFTDARRQEFIDKRRALTQSQIKRQLSLPVNDVSSRKSKTALESRNAEIKIVPAEDSESDENRDPLNILSPYPSSYQASGTVTPSDNTDDGLVSPNPDALDVPQRRGLAQRRQSLIRTSSFQVRSANTITRKAVGIISKSLESKKKRHTPITEKEVKENKKRLGRKYSVMWMSKTAESKRMDLTKGIDDEDFTPFNKFRRAARLVKSLIQVCRVCQDLVLDSVSSEDWYKKIESYIDSTEMISKAQGPSKLRPFITFVQDAKSKQLVQLTFDKSLYTRERRADYLLTADIRNYLQIPSFERTMEQENEVLMFMKRAVPEFNSFTLEAQRRIAQCMHYDKYERDRVITRQGLTADGVYFILSGTLIVKGEDKKNLREMKPGELFGEEDIICACPRRNTVITRSVVELVSIHRLDYRAIVHMADDSSHPKYLDVCKHDIVFQHFPMKKLIDNPGVWTLLSYKYGRLIVKDSNEMEWIYIIKSGEAKVLKHLTVGKIDLIERRKNIKAKKNQTDPHAFKRKMISFVSEREYLKSHYRRGEYRPGTTCVSPSSSTSSARSTHSAPSTARRFSEGGTTQQLTEAPYMAPIKDKAPFTLRRDSTRIGDMLLADRANTSDDVKRRLSQMSSESNMNLNENEAEDNESDRENELEFGADDLDPEKCETPSPTGVSKEHESSVNRETRVTIVEDENQRKHSNTLRKQASYIDTSTKTNVKFPALEKIPGSKSPDLNEEKQKKMTKIPPFVQLESLHAGKVFGLRSCLPADERGPSASLVSGGCEVLQVNKKFFMKHADEALIGLIRVQYKPFPTEDDLIDRLDNNFQWEEYKQNTLGDYLIHKGKMKEEELKDVTIELKG